VFCAHCGARLSFLYRNASIETKKMIVSCLIKRVEVGRDYKLNIDFNFDLRQFFYGLDFSF